MTIQDTLIEEAKQLQERLKIGLVSKNEMRKMENNAVSRSIDWQRKNQRYINRYQELRRLLPTLPNIESLRREY